MTEPLDTYPAPAVAPTSVTQLRAKRISLLNGLFFCVGYILLGQWKKGFCTIVSALVFGPATFGVVTVLIAIFAAADGYAQARVQDQGRQIGPWTYFNSSR